MLLSVGQVSDYKGAALMIDALPKQRHCSETEVMTPTGSAPPSRGRGISACIPSQKNHEARIPPDAILYRQRHEIENMFGRIKDWRRIPTRYDRGAHLHVRHLHRRCR